MDITRTLPMVNSCEEEALPTSTYDHHWPCRNTALVNIQNTGRSEAKVFTLKG